jgi:hypothetical protein
MALHYPETEALDAVLDPHFQQVGLLSHWQACLAATMHTRPWAPQTAVKSTIRILGQNLLPAREEFLGVNHGCVLDRLDRTLGSGSLREPGAGLT